jgi:hypothetical protein
LQVKQLLAGDPGNAEFQEMAKGLTEVSVKYLVDICACV